jgi:hypothetical protein
MRPVEPFLVALHGGSDGIYIQLLVCPAHQSLCFSVFRRIGAFGVGYEAFKNQQRGGEVSLVEKRLYKACGP